MKTGLKKSQKTTEIYFDEKDPLIHIRTHNTDLKIRLSDYAASTPSNASGSTQTRTRAVWNLKFKRDGFHSG